MARFEAKRNTVWRGWGVFDNAAKNYVTNEPFRNQRAAEAFAANMNANPGQPDPQPASPIQRVMNEVVLYGGLPLRRADVYRVALEDTGDRRAADQIAFGGQYPVVPSGSPVMTIKEFRYTNEKGRLPKGWRVKLPARLSR